MNKTKENKCICVKKHEGNSRCLRKVVIVGALEKGTGNHSTCQRIAKYLANDFEPMLEDLTSWKENSPEIVEILNWLNQYVDFVIGIHAFRAGRFLRFLKVSNFAL